MFPHWMRKLSTILEWGTLVRVVCTSCDATRDLRMPEIAALIEKVGPDYSLINRRCRCRLTPNCRGWNRFRYNGAGGMYPLWTEAQEARWNAEP